jgi:glutathione S-transferase/GST-like protein
MSRYVLHGYPQSGSGAVEVALAAGNIPYELRDLDPEAGDLKSPDFLALNPRGQVPILVLPDGSVVTEIPAMLLHLADANSDSGLAPPPGSALRAQHDRWLTFTHANLYEGVLRIFYSDRYTTDPQGADAVGASAEAYVRHHLEMLDSVIGDGPFLFGKSPMAVDCLIWILVTWLDPDLLAGAPRIAGLATALAAEPRINAVAHRHL